jgi:hypothetical protein
LTERDLDRLLSDWLGDGPGGASDEIADRAILEIADMGQAGRGLWPMWTGIARPLTGRPDGGSHLLRTVVLGASVILLAVSIGIGIGFQTGVIRYPEPAPGPVEASQEPTPSRTDESPAPSEAAADPLTLWSNPRLGYEILLPSSWTTTLNPGEASFLLFGPSHDGNAALGIMIGQPDGRVTMCRLRPGPCFEHTVTTAAEIGELLRTGDWPETHVDTSLSGWPATIEYLDRDESGLPQGAYAVIDGRPVVLRFNPATLERLGITDDVVRDIIASFRILFETDDPPRPSGSPEIVQPESVNGFRTFVAPDGSFEVRLREAWRTVAGPDPVALYLRDRGNTITIRGADSEGSVVTCDDPAGSWETCETISPSTLVELADGMGFRSGGRTLFYGPMKSAATLGGEPALEIRAIGCCVKAVTYLVALHDGRSIIARHVTPGGSPIDVEELLDELSFLAGAAD